MKCNGNINFNPLDQQELELIGTSNEIFLQDGTHNGTKLRNRLLKPSILLPFGNKIISVTHLKILLLNVPKDVHGLVATDILPEDRQNFHSLEKIMESRVLEALDKYVLDSEATVVYLTLCKNVTSCCLDKNLNPLERLFRIWNSVFILRIWSDFLTAANYSAQENFVSQNVYDCIEVNAICLTRCIMCLRNNEIPGMFKPYLFDSQPCERTFRQMRSMTTLNWTRINFGILDLLNLIERVELQNDIIYHRLANIIKFPRVTMNQCADEFELPSNEDILVTIKKSLKAAVETTSKFEMAHDELNIGKCRSKKPRIWQKQNLTDEFSDEEFDEDLENVDSIENRMEHLNLRSYDNVAASGAVDEGSKFIEVYDEENGSSKIVLKSSIVWLLSDSTAKLSSDRLKRVQGTHPHKLDNVKLDAKRPRFNPSNLALNPRDELASQQVFLKSDKIYLGDWCVFGFDRENYSNVCMPEENLIQNILIGSIIAFKYTMGSTEKDKQYHLELANVLDEQQIAQRDDIELLAAWYTLDINGILISLGTNRNFFVNMKKYIATTTEPATKKMNNNKILSLVGNVTQIKNTIRDLMK